MKKIISVMMLMVLVLTGCNSNNSESIQQLSIDDDRVEEAQIDVWLPAGKNTDWFEYALNEYNKEFGTNITAQISDVSPADVVAKATPMLSAKQTMPDLMFIQDQNLNDLFSQFPDVFVNLNDYGLDEEYWSAFAPKKIEMMTDLTGGDVYGFPTDFAPTMVYYRQDLFDEVGIDYEQDINTMQDLIDAGETIYEQTGVQMIGLSAPADSTFFKIMLQMQGGIYYRDGKFQFDTEAAKKAAEYTVQVEESPASAKYVTSDMSGPATQNASIVLNGSWWGGSNERNSPDLAGKWRVGSLPPFEEGMDPVVPANGGSAMYVPVNSDETLAALQVAEYIYYDPEVAGNAIEKGITTANLLAYDTQYGGQPNEYYGGQKVSDLYMENFANIGTNVGYDISQSSVEKIIGAEIGKAVDGAQTIDEALAAIQKQCEATVQTPNS